MHASWSGSAVAILAVGAAVSLGVTAVVIVIVAASLARRRRNEDRADS